MRSRATICSMAVNPLTDLLKLPADDRAEIAIALWESLTDAERDRAFELTDDQRVELDRRWAEHQGNPDSAVPWSQVRRKLPG
jgi:putative addiction module component (TIGR02574 family)